MMRTNRQPKVLPSSPGVISAIALLLALLLTEVCSATEVTFGERYSLQLPAGWTAKPGKDNAVVGGTRGMNFTANGGATKQSPEEIMEKAIGLTEKRDGYKFIEKGPVKNSAGATGYLFRYQLEEGGPPFMGVNYYLRLGEKDFVALLFGIASDTPKSVKSEIEAIVNSVKIVSATAQDDSWLSNASPSASPKNNTAPAPAAPKTSGNPVTFGSNCSVVMPSGWTAKSGEHLQATGPGGTILDGFSVKGALSIDDTVADLTTMLGKTFPGFKLLETSEIDTRAGAKGKVLSYRHDGKAGALSDLGLCLVIKVAEDQIVTLRFHTPNAPKKMDETFLDDVHAIYRSLKIE